MGKGKKEGGGFLESKEGQREKSPMHTLFSMPMMDYRSNQPEHHSMEEK